MSFDLKETAPEWAELSSRYDLGKINGIKMIDPGNATLLNLWRLSTERGFYVLITFEDSFNGVTENRSSAINLILQRISRLEIGLPYILESCDGCLSGELHGRSFILTEWVDGNEFNSNDPLQHGSAGHLLASIHRLLRSSELDSDQNDFLGNFTRETYADSAADLFSLNDRLYRHSLEILEDCVQQLNEFNYWDLPSTITGFNYVYENLACHWHSVTGIRNVMGLGRDVRLIDITTFVCSEKIANQNAAHFLDSYSSVSEIEDNELKLIPYVNTLLRFRDCIYSIKMSEKSGPEIRSTLTSAVKSRIESACRSHGKMILFLEDVINKMKGTG